MPQANLNVSMKVIPQEKKTINFDFGQKLGEPSFPNSQQVNQQNQGRVVNFVFKPRGPEANGGFLNLPEPSFEETNTMLIGTKRF